MRSPAIEGIWLRRRTFDGARHWEVPRYRGFSCCLALVFVLVFMFSIGASLGVRGNLPRQSPLAAAPTIQSCDFFPDPRTNVSFVCGVGDNSFQPGFVNAPVRFRVNVSGETNLNVTFYFDYLNPNASGPPVINPDSPVRTLNVPSPGAGNTAMVETSWTYTALGNFSSGSYWIYVEVRDDTGQNGTWSPPFFPVVVKQNSEPFLSGLNTLYSVAEAIDSHDKRIPLFYLNVSADDPDYDPLSVTWYWGDRTWSVNLTGPTTIPVRLNVTHQYSADEFPFNETPRYVRFPITIWVDDRVGHNLSFPSSVEFYINIDFPPSVGSDKPAVGSVWKVGEPVPMAANVTDPEGDPLITYWDFDNRTDSSLDGDPTRDRDANGTSASHAYSLPGQYNITVWATDGETKNRCFDYVNCTSNSTGYHTHWTNLTIPIQVRPNQQPFLALDNSTGLRGKPTLIRAVVFDQDGDSMTVTWMFGDDTPDATNVTPSSPRGTPQIQPVSQNHTYGQVGRYNLTLIVSDGNSTTQDTKEVFVESFNEPPGKPGLEVLRTNGTSAGNNTFRLNDTAVLRVTLFDPENDTLDVTVDWGDGSVTAGRLNFTTAQGCAFVQVADTTQYACPITFSHAYENIGSNESREYNVLVTVTDNQVYFQRDPTGGPPIILNHAPNQTVILIVENPQTGGLGPWDWWDYGTLALAVGLPVGLIGRFAYKVRKERKEE